MNLPLLSLIFSSLVVQLRSAPLHQSRFSRNFLRDDNAAASPQEYFEVKKPLSFDHLSPKCTLPILNHNFSNTYGLPPFTARYSPPCKTWSHVMMEIQIACQGEQYDRIAAVWLHGAELIRTSTAEPTEDGVFWKVRKDVTRYSSLLSQKKLSLSVMLENIVNDVFTGVYQVNVTFFYYDVRIVCTPSSLISDDLMPSRKLKFVETPVELNSSYEEGSRNFCDRPASADLIIPISATGENGFWFRIQNESDVHTKEIQIPGQVYKALIEIHVSFHGNDEFWYSNPPDSYIELNNLTTKRGHGAFREVLVKIDGKLVGTVIPFPVIFTGGINPLFWEPVVSIGAFELPTYDLDLTPYLGMLLDGKSHAFGLSVSDSIRFWLLNANLHLWLDDGSKKVEAAVDYKVPVFNLKRQFRFLGLNGTFTVRAKRKIRVSGWVKSKAGNFTTSITRQLRFKNVVQFSGNGKQKLVRQMVMETSEVIILSDIGSKISRSTMRKNYPLMLTSESMPAKVNDTYVLITKLENGIVEKKTVGGFPSTFTNSQQCQGWIFVQDHNILSGSGNLHQTYLTRDVSGCYSRTVAAENGKIVNDTPGFLCVPSL